ncbi:alpha/beta hydrolase [Arenibacter certesii]|uniref:Endo-1,4-beta-xylanase n=1 Tax=Arenibacter certesii TaxID=228955 RepID=A0A918IX00_9FLAO|nr:alpha/beta hydrolase-fold protein [Arenibacter certesii]GGW36051.1 endo-1,4-beta-xylanase [Arenibacter certesii]
MIIREISVSDPKHEVENLRYLTVQSSYLKGRADITVFVPPGNEQISDLPVAILLHGVYASHWAWTRHMNVHNIALDLIVKKVLPPMVLVMPSDGLWGEGSGYLAHSGFDFEKWIAEDVIEAVRRVIGQVGDKSKWFMAGLSMGGYGALRIGAKYPYVFTAFSGHSSITNFEGLELFVDDVNPYRKNNGDESVIGCLLKNKDKLLSFRFDCGVDDPLIAHNRKLHNGLEDHGIKHIYEEFKGGHTTQYWKEHIVRSLKFFASRL